MTCLSGRKSSPRKRVWCKPPWVQIPPSPPQSHCSNPRCPHRGFLLCRGVRPHGIHPHPITGPPAFPSSAGLPGGNASFTVVHLSSRRLLALPTGTLVLRANACATAQAYDRKASEPSGKVREVAAPSGNACLLVVCWPSRRLPVFPASACLPGGNACLAGECLRYSAGV